MQQHKWYVVRVISSQEKKVKKALEENRQAQGMADLISEVLIPIENVVEVKKGKQRISEKRLWPNYILVNMTLTDDSWMYVKNTNGVIDFLGGERPNVLPQHEIDAILADLESKKQAVVHKHDIQINDRVKIVDGLFVNSIGTVQQVFPEKGRLNVLISIFGRETCVQDLEFWQVEQVPYEVEKEV